MGKQGTKKKKKLFNKHIDRIDQTLKNCINKGLDNKARWLLSHLDKPVLIMSWPLNESEKFSMGYELLLLVQDYDGFYYLKLQPTRRHTHDNMTLMTRQWMYDLAGEFNDYRITSIADSFYSKFDKNFDFESEIGGTMSFGEYQSETN